MHFDQPVCPFYREVMYLTVWVQGVIFNALLLLEKDKLSSDDSEIELPQVNITGTSASSSGISMPEGSHKMA